jgi:hypothetical protein
MKIIYSNLTIIILFCCLLHPVSAQVNNKQKINSYDTWIKIKNDPITLRGVLYEIKDSSIIIANPALKKGQLTGAFDVTSIPISNIDLLKTRKAGSIRKRILIGSLAGFSAGAIYPYISAETGKMGLITATYSIAGGATLAIFGVGVGALAGSVKDRIPLRNSYENLDKYRSWLEKYSYIQESPTRTGFFEHRSFVAMTSGPSFPTGDFDTESVNGDDLGYVRTGYGGNIYVGFRFNQKFGVFLSQTYNIFPVGIKGTTTYWSVGGIIGGPLFSFRLNEKLFLDLKPGIGYANAYLVVDESIVKERDGNGLGINFNVSLLYNYSKRWGFLAELGYFTTQQRFGAGSTGKFPSVTPSLGLTYKFGKESLSS